MSEFPKSWTLLTLAEIVPPDAPIIYGILQPGPHINDGIPYIRPTEITDGNISTADLRRTTKKIANQYNRASLESGDVILSIVGTIGKVAIVPPELEGANITQSSCRIRPDKSLIYSEFLSAFLRSSYATEQYKQYTLGTGVPRLNLQDVRQFHIQLPPLSEQERIVNKVKVLEERVRRARKELALVDRIATETRSMSPLIEKLSQAILSKAFRGELVQYDQADEPASVLLGRIRAERAAAGPGPKRGRRPRGAVA